MILSNHGSTLRNEKRGKNQFFFLKDIKNEPRLT